MKVPASIEAASRVMEPRQGRVYACPSVLAFALFMILVVPTPKAFAARLGGAYYVDDAEIGKPGSCEFESWSSFAANGDRIAVFSPACVVNFGPPIELGTNIVNLRSDGRATRSLRSRPRPCRYRLVHQVSGSPLPAPSFMTQATKPETASSSMSLCRSISARASGSM